jgi:hypothetical protein
MHPSRDVGCFNNVQITRRDRVIFAVLPDLKSMTNTKSNMNMLLAAIAIFVFAIFLFAKSRSTPKPETLSNSDVIEEMKVRAASAVVDARDNYSIELDYSSDSIEEVERILNKIHRQHREEPIDNAELNRLRLKWGGYVGEVIKRLRKAEWQLDSKIAGPGSLPVVYEKSGESFPVMWCLKRIVNGPEDSVWDKFNLLVVNRDSEPSGAVTFFPDGTVTGLDTAEQSDGHEAADRPR